MDDNKVVDTLSGRRFMHVAGCISACISLGAAHAGRCMRVCFGGYRCVDMPNGRTSWVVHALAVMAAVRGRDSQWSQGALKGTAKCIVGTVKLHRWLPQGAGR